MSGMIKISGNGINNNPPSITNLRVEGKITVDSFTIKYKAEDFENAILRHYLILDGVKTEITKDVGYEQPNNEFSYTLTKLKYNTKYQVQIEASDGVNISVSSILETSTSDAWIYGVKVDETNSNPISACTYTEGAIGISSASSNSFGGWYDKFPFNQIKIIGFKNGQETKEINPNNKTQYKDGSTVPTDVDVMIRIPKIYWKTIQYSNGYEVQISNVKIDSTWDCYAHKVNGIEKKYIYVGAYLGYVEGGKLRSKSGVTPSTSRTLTQFRDLAKANGNGYCIFNWFSLKILQILYLLAYKNLNSQSALGMGNVDGSRKNTGATDTLGYNYGTSNNSTTICFLGVEDLWGNTIQWIDGLYVDGSANVKILTDNVNFSNLSSYENNGVLGKISSGKINKISPKEKSIFTPISFGGSDSTFYCDFGRYNINCYSAFGGSHQDGLDSGIFALRINWGISQSNSDLSTRLCYLG